MFIFGHKKKRSPRGKDFRPTSAWTGGITRIFSDRTILIPLLFVAIAVCSLVVVLEGWKTAFPYRVGDRAAHDVSARVDFKRVNRVSTERMRTEAATRVPPIFIHDSNRLSTLPTRLRSSLVEISNAKRLNDVGMETRNAFGLADRNGNAASRQDHFRNFLLLKGTPNSEDAGPRIDALVHEFEKFITPLNRRGLARESDIAKLKLPAGAKITISDGASRTDELPVDVLIRETLKPTGLLGKQWGNPAELQPYLSKLIPLKDLLTRWIENVAPVTLRYDLDGTKAARRTARDKVPEQTDLIPRGTPLVPSGEVIDNEKLADLRAEYEAVEEPINGFQRLGRIGIVFVMLLVLATLIGYYIVQNEPEFIRSPGRLAVYLGAFVLTVGVGRMLASGSWRAEIIPLTATVMIFAIAYNQGLAFITALALSLILALSTSGQLSHFVVLMSVSATTVILLSDVPARSVLIKVGFWSAAVYFAISWGTGIIQNHSIGGAWSDTNLLLTSLKGAGCCLVAGFLVAGSLPFIESAFGVVTDISLLEMSDVSHPLLQELVRRGPGTYNHSMTVASIGETAADAIGANGLLVRVGAYFHDVGKTLKPQYFVENMTEGEKSRHENLAPAMSTLIIIGHVKDGVDLARQHNLPERLIDFIEQHHGTTLVEYFYREAEKRAEEQPDHKTDVEESSFRYPGPKPQSREAGVMMLADAVESASRTLNEPTPKRLSNLVERITLKRLLDNQFDESTLTLSEIRIVEDSLIKSLIGIYHGRIKYPEQRTA